MIKWTGEYLRAFNPLDCWLKLYYFIKHVIFFQNQIKTRIITTILSCNSLEITKDKRSDLRIQSRSHCPKRSEAHSLSRRWTDLVPSQYKTIRYTSTRSEMVGRGSFTDENCYLMKKKKLCKRKGLFSCGRNMIEGVREIVIDVVISCIEWGWDKNVFIVARTPISYNSPRRSARTIRLL